MNWYLLLGEGLVSLVFSLMLSTAGSTTTYLMLASLAERDAGVVLGLTYVEAAPRLAAVVYAVFFFVTLLSLTRLRIYERAATRPLRHWALAFILYGLLGLLPGLVYWLLFLAADRPSV